ncbi:MAG: helix-turn-helix transcriptional regulator [Pyrinomonadaceae bacterium]
MPLKQKYKNQLLLVRKKSGLEQKQVATLLGHKTADQISRYERGAKLPNLKTAIKLGIVYRLPIRVLFYGYYEACLDEIKKQETVLKNIEKGFNLSKNNFSDDVEFCPFAERLKPLNVKSDDLDKARSHIAELVRTRAEKMNHF